MKMLCKKHGVEPQTGSHKSMKFDNLLEYLRFSCNTVWYRPFEVRYDFGG